jgi:2-phospho-L-lactate guanylyltransferase
LIWAVVPVKGGKHAKSRLSAVLSAAERAELSRRLLVRTVHVLGCVPTLERTLVVSRDAQMLSLAEACGAVPVIESGQPGLNHGLAQATPLTVAGHATALLVLPADLPLLDPHDFETLLARSTESPTVVIAPDRHDRGTNALVISPPGLIEYAFGAGSFERHLALARRSGAAVEVCRTPGLGFDLDSPEDLELLQAQEKANPGGTHLV